MDDRWQASEKLKDLLIEEKKSRWPLVVGILLMLAVLSAGGAWFYLPPEKRPPLDQMKARLFSAGRSVLNAPIMKAPGSAPTTNPSQAPGNPSAPPPSSDDNSLLGK